ncbi:MAG: NAD(+)/NADH kinase [Pseudomonadota bacterium]
MPLRIALLVNPWSGIGGALALQGSDGIALRERALAAGGIPRSPARVERFLAALAQGLPAAGDATQIHWLTVPGAMGAQWLRPAGGAESPWPVQVLPAIDRATRIAEDALPATEAQHTRAAAAALVAQRPDLLVFVGGDGTARDLLDAQIGSQLTLGVPAGVKMHSGVFATTPERAADLVLRLLRGDLVAVTEAQVRDLDEARRRAGALRTRDYGLLRVPLVAGYVQQTKVAGRESEPLVLEELAAHWQDHAQGQVILGPGGSCARVKEALGLAPTLLGVDVWREGACEARNVDALWLERHAPDPAAVVLSFTRQQGFLLGRGNAQFSARWLRDVPRERLRVIGSRSKLASLEGRPLLVDTDDPALNETLRGLIPVLCGYEDELLYRVD